MTNDKLAPLMMMNAASTSSIFDIEDGQEFQTEGATIKAYFTPGHSDDHLIFYEKNEEAVFTGDCILGYGSSVFASFPDFMKSLHFIKEMNPVKLYPAHGPNVPQTSSSSSSSTTTNSDDHNQQKREETRTYIENYINHRLKREVQILDILSSLRKTNDVNQQHQQQLDLMSLVDKVYGDQIAGQPKLRMGAAGNTLHILKKLVLEKKVVVDFSEAIKETNISEEEVKELLDTTKDYSNDVYLARLAAEHAAASNNNKNQQQKEGGGAAACSCSPQAQNLLLQKVERLKWKLA